MKRDVDIRDISDGKLYKANDLVKADCQDCKGCFACCEGMGESIILDPLDVHRMVQGLGCDFSRLMELGAELGLVDGVILPHLRMEEQSEKCSFLNKEGRCSIHPYRPGICRMFPLGRVYEEEGFSYFLQIYECRKQDRSKIKVKKWLDTPLLKTYEQFVWDWHQFLLACGEAAQSLDEQQMRTLSLYILRTFYQTPFGEDFYGEFYRRRQMVEETLGI